MMDPQRRTKNGWWQELHVDLLCLVARKLGLSDRVTLSLVCRSWRQWKQVYLLSAREMPGLVLPRDRYCPYLRVLCLSRGGRIENIRLPQPFERRDFVGSSNGWLIFISYNGILFLFNPVSGAVLRLPSLGMIPICVLNVTVSSSQVSESLMVAAIVGIGPAIMVCKPASGGWRTLRARRRVVPNFPRVFSDILFKGDTLFAVTQIHPTISAPARGHYRCHLKQWKVKERCTELGASSLKIVIIKLGDPLITKYIDTDYHGSVHLALSTREEVMMAVRWYSLIGGEENPSSKHSRTESILVYMLSTGEEGAFLNQVEGIGEEMLFVGRVHSQMLCSKAFDGAGRNSVAFTEQCYRLRASQKNYYAETGMFHLGDESTESSYSTHPYPFYLDWFLPASSS